MREVWRAGGQLEWSLRRLRMDPVIRCPTCGSTSKIIRMMDRVKPLLGVKNDQEIARLFKVDDNLISNFRRKLGIKGIRTWDPVKRTALETRRKRPSVQTITALRLRGWTFRRIGKEFGITGAWVQQKFVGRKR